MTTRVQSDVKSSLAYAALTQVGVIVVEIALGWYTLAFVHLAGHACFRLLQFLSAPNVLHDLHGLENAFGGRPATRDGAIDRLAPERLRRRLYLAAIERGFLDRAARPRRSSTRSRAWRSRMRALDRWLVRSRCEQRPRRCSRGSRRRMSDLTPLWLAMLAPSSLMIGRIALPWTSSGSAG